MDRDPEERSAAARTARRGVLRRCSLCGRWHAWGIGEVAGRTMRLCRSCLDQLEAQQQQQQQQ